MHNYHLLSRPVTGPWKQEKECASARPFDFLNEAAVDDSGWNRHSVSGVSRAEKSTIVVPIDRPHTHKRAAQKPADDLTRFHIHLNF